MGSFSFSLPFTVIYYRVLLCFGSGYVRKIPGSEHRLQVFSWALPSAMLWKLESHTAYSSLTWWLPASVLKEVFRVALMLEKKENASAWYYRFIDIGCQKQKFMRISWCIFWLDYEMQLGCLLLKFFLYKAFISSAGQQARVYLCPFVLWCTFSPHTVVEACAY